MLFSLGALEEEQGEKASKATMSDVGIGLHRKLGLWSHRQREATIAALSAEGAQSLRKEEAHGPQGSLCQRLHR